MRQKNWQNASRFAVFLIAWRNSARSGTMRRIASLVLSIRFPAAALVAEIATTSVRIYVLAA
jgi:hypothetical protein